MKTIFINNENAKRDWYIVDAEGKTLGRPAYPRLSRYLSRRPAASRTMSTRERIPSLR